MINSLQDSLDMLMSSTYSDTQPGAAVLISAGGETLYEKGFGLANLATGEPVTPHTNFRLASVSKQFTTASVQLLEQRGLLSYEDDLLTFFPQFSLVGAQVTLRHLLTHTSGLQDYEDFVVEKPGFQVTDEEVLDIVAAQTTTYFVPGTRYRYSNTGFVLLALVVEKVTGIGYDRFLEENIFEPLGMHTTTLYTSEKPIASRAMGYARGAGGEAVFADQGTCTATKGDGCIYTSVRDYLQWHKALNSDSGIAPALNRVNFPLEGYQNGYYGMGWFFSRRRSGSLEMHHTGNTSGFSNLVIRIPENDVLIAYFSNLADNPHLLTGFLDTLQEFPALRPESGLVRDLLKLTR
jgi:CubicO group peptidase (beta-lactamase class C family)